MDESEFDYVKPKKEKTTEEKLGDLLMKGWIILAESCFAETCNTPLMKNPMDGNKYCCGCEMWVSEKTRTKQTFTELVSLDGKQTLQLKNQKSEVSTIPKKIDINPNVNISVTTTLQNKLYFFTNQLNNETDLGKCKELLDCIDKSIYLIRESKGL